MMTFAALGDSAVVATLGEAASEAVLGRVRRLAQVLERARLPGIVDVVPAYATVTVFYEAARFAGGERTVYEEVCRAVAACAEAAVPDNPPESPSIASCWVKVPVCYGGDFGPDLAAVAAHGGISEAGVIARHSGGDYRVQAIGFAPGFPYLAGLPESLRMPRRPTPRTAVPAGSVGIGGAQTGVYPLESPGGWQVIGRTPLPLFRPEADSPSLLQVGERVEFQPIDPKEFHRLERQFREALPRPARDICHAIRDKTPSVEVVRPGLLATVQDLGRKGHRAAGLPLSGAMDPFALRVANLLVGNPEDEAVLEVTLLGPELLFSADAVVAVCGAEFEGVTAWRPVRVPAGGRIKFGECRRGCRAYLAVAGGFDVPPILGSRSTTLRAGLGGWEGRALRAGDRLGLRPAVPGPGVHASAHEGSWRISPAILPAYASAITLRVIPGAQAGDFGTSLADAEFQVSPRSDRMGLRLTGPVLARQGTVELASTAVAPGTVQVPPDGQPILLMADAQTIGGYPQAAHVIGPDLPLAAQLRPGDHIRFREIPLEEAHALALARERELAHLRAGLQA